MQLFKTPNFDFIRWRWYAIGLSLLVILAGAALMATRGVPLGIDFSGGTIVIVKFDQPVNVSKSALLGPMYRQRVRATIDLRGVSGAQTSDGEPHLRIRKM